MTRIRREFALALTLVLLVTPSAHAQFADADWELLLPQDRLLDVTVWNGRVVGADPLAGLLFYDPETSTLTPFTVVDGLTTNRARSLLVDDANRLWVGTVDAGLVLLEPDGGIDPITSLAGQGEIRALDRDGGFVYYASTSGGGAITEGDGFPEQVFDQDQGLPSDDVVDVAAYDGRVWFATPAGVGFFDRAANAVGTLNTGLSGPDVAAVAAGPDGVFAAVGQSIFALDESVPGSPTWSELLPGPGFTVRALEVADGEIVALGTASRVQRRALDDTVWTLTSDDPATIDWIALHRTADGELWTAGRRVDRSGDRDGDSVTQSSPLFWSSVGGNSPALPFVLGESARALEGDGAGGVWVGYFSPEDVLLHWRADGSVTSYPLFDSAQDQGDGDGWLTGVKFGIERAPNGDLWVANFADTGGLTRFRPHPSDDPALAEYFHLTVSDDVLQTRRILDMDVDERGWVWLASDGGITPNGDRNLGLDVLVNPSAPDAAASWRKITASNSSLAGDAIDAVAVRGDVVWLGVSGVGLQRWDIGGAGTDLEGAAAQSGRWDLITALPEFAGASIANVSDIVAVEDARVWISTDDQGVFVFDYAVDITDDEVTRFEVSEFAASLITNQQRRVVAATADVAWSGGEGGVHRLSVEDGVARIDPFTNLGFFLQSGLDTRFGAEILSPLPNASVWSLWLDETAEQLVVGTDLGLARVRLRTEGDALPEAFEVVLRPNPLRANDELYVTDFEGTLDVYVYTLGGRLVFRTRDLVDGERAWDTRNVMNEPVVSGLYLVRLVRSDGAEVLRTVAIER